jgi:hypothetical protein
LLDAVERRREAQRRYQAKKRLDPDWQEKNREYMKGYRRRNAARLAEQGRKYQQDNALEIRLKKKGLDLAHIEQIKAHDGLCDICGNPPDGKWGELAIDHCHEGGGFRGLLCSSCNMALGLFKDDPDILRKAAEYVEKHQGNKVGS